MCVCVCVCVCMCVCACVCARVCMYSRCEEVLFAVRLRLAAEVPDERKAYLHRMNLIQQDIGC